MYPTYQLLYGVMRSKYMKQASDFERFGVIPMPAHINQEVSCPQTRQVIVLR